MVGGFMSKSAKAYPEIIPLHKEKRTAGA